MNKEYKQHLQTVVASINVNVQTLLQPEIKKKGKRFSTLSPDRPKKPKYAEFFPSCFRITVRITAISLSPN